MSIRELTTSELVQVSGAWSQQESDQGIAGLQSLLKIGQVYADTDPKFRGMDPHVIVATVPDLRNAMIKSCEMVGGGGLATIDLWMQMYG